MLNSTDPELILNRFRILFEGDGKNGNFHLEKNNLLREMRIDLKEGRSIIYPYKTNVNKYTHNNSRIYKLFDDQLESNGCQCI